MVTLPSVSLKNSLKRLAGLRERLSTLTSSGTDSSFGKLSRSMTETLATVLLENERLKEELRLIKLERDCEHDV